MNPNEAYLGIDYGGYDGSKFHMCVMVNGVVVKMIVKSDEEEFKAEVEKVFELYNTKHLLMEIHPIHKHKQLNYEKRLDP